MRRTGTDLMATGVIMGSTALAVAATLAFARANPGDTLDSATEYTPRDAHWSVMYAVTVDGDVVRSTPAKWRWHMGFRVPRADRINEAAARAEAAGEQVDAVRERLEAVKELAEERRHLRETVLKQLEANSAGER